MSDGSQEPKIVVDDDWKERVRAEREAARAAQNAPDEKTESETAPEHASAGAPAADHFTMLLSMLATQAMVALGKIPDPLQGHAVVRPNHAKQAIDMLAMLDEKTKGNLTTDEAEMLSDLLHEMRMLFLAIYRSPEDASAPLRERQAPGPETETD